MTVFEPKKQQQPVNELVISQGFKKNYFFQTMFSCEENNRSMSDGQHTLGEWPEGGPLWFMKLSFEHTIPVLRFPQSLCFTLFECPICYVP